MFTSMSPSTVDGPAKFPQFSLATNNVTFMRHGRPYVDLSEYDAVLRTAKNVLARARILSWIASVHGFNWETT